MELGFIMAMACLVTVGCIYLCLIVKNERRKCGSCKFFTPKGKYCGTCNGFGESRFKWELCGHWKRIPKEESKEESFKKGDWVRIVAYHNDYILSWVGPIKNSSEYCILFDFCICGGYDVRMNLIVKLTDMGDERFAYKIQKEEIEIIKKVYDIKEYLAMTVMSKKQMRKEG